MWNITKPIIQYPNMNNNTINENSDQPDNCNRKTYLRLDLFRTNLFNIQI